MADNKPKCPNCLTQLQAGHSGAVKAAGFRQYDYWCPRCDCYWSVEAIRSRLTDIIRGLQQQAEFDKRKAQNVEADVSSSQQSG